MGIIALVVCPLTASGEEREKPREAGPFERPIVLAVEFNSHAACAHVARARAWYKEAGIGIRTFDSYVTGMALAAGLTRGDVDAASMCLIPAICAYANGGVPLRVVSGTHLYGYALVVDPEKISAPADLQRSGVRIGCAREGSPTDAVLHKAISAYGMDKGKVINNVRRMNPPRQLLALRMGHLDAAVMPEQYPSMAEADGFSILVRARDLWPGMQGSVLVVTERLITGHPEIVSRLVRVTRKSTRWINAHPESAARIVSKVLRSSGDRIFPARAAGLACTSDVSPEAVLASLTGSLVCTTTVEPLRVQQAIDYLAELGYIRQGFDAGKILALWREEP